MLLYSSREQQKSLPSADSGSSFSTSEEIPLAIHDVLVQIDLEIARLQQARALLSDSPSPTAAPKAGRGRPKGSKNAAPTESATPVKKTKRKLSPEGRKAIADAMKRRWAERRKQTTK